MTIFRKRMGFVPDGPPMIDAIPPRVRVGLKHIVEDHLDTLERSWAKAYDEMLRASRRAAVEEGWYELQATAVIYQCDWLEFYEIIEHLATKTKAYDVAHGPYYRYERPHFARFREELNQLLADENVGYELDDAGKIQMNASRDMVEASAAALATLTAVSLVAPGKQLHRALEKLTFRQLDPTNAVKDAVGALQGVLAARFGGKGYVSDNAATLRSMLHPTLAAAVDSLVKIEAYRGDMAAHADKAAASVTTDEAIFVVHACSAAIALLATKGRGGTG